MSTATHTTHNTSFDDVIDMTTYAASNPSSHSLHSCHSLDLYPSGERRLRLCFARPRGGGMAARARRFRMRFGRSKHNLLPSFKDELLETPAVLITPFPPSAGSRRP